MEQRTQTLHSAIIEADGLTKRFGSFTAVDGISFHVEPGECFGLLGPNGAGKSSTFRMICCVSPLSGGRLLVDGQPASTEARRVKAILGVVPQDTNLDPELSVRQNLEVYSRYHDLPAVVARARIVEALAFLQLSEWQHSRVETLSGGMKRRLLIARALLNAPKVLVLDEPTTGLDPQARLLIWQKVRALQRDGVTILLTTHYMEEAAALCDRLAIMHHGRILAEGTPAALLAQLPAQEVLELPLASMSADVMLALDHQDRPATQEVADRLYLYSSDSDGLRRRLAELGVHTVQRPVTLEDVFLRLTGATLTD